MAAMRSGLRPGQENAIFIGAGVTLRGEASSPGAIVVEGLVEGRIAAPVVIVGQTGVIQGEIDVNEAEVSGYVADDVAVKRLLIVRATGRVEGRVLYGGIELEKGAVVSGDLSAIDDSPSVSAKGALPLTRRALP